MTTILLHGVRWETYEALSCDLQDQNAPRLAYDHGDLEIMSPLPAHEERKDVLALFVSLFSLERRIPWKGAGSSTFRRVAQERGFEPDACFYIQSASLLPTSLSGFNAQTLPPPDLIIEIDITHPSLDKLPLYTTLGVREIWRDDAEQVHILRRDGDVWAEVEESGVLPGVTSAVLTRFVTRALETDSLTWSDEVRAWSRQPRNEEQIP